MRPPIAEIIKCNMKEVELKLATSSPGETSKGAFVIEDNGRRVAEMVVGIAKGNMTVYHTEVAPELKGQGIAPKLLAAMAEHARNNDLKVIPLCPYVNAQFRRKPDEYTDIWNQTWHQ